MNETLWNVVVIQVGEFEWLLNGFVLRCSEGGRYSYGLYNVSKNVPQNADVGLSLDLLIPFSAYVTKDEYSVTLF
jgi:hypothetical protein